MSKRNDTKKRKKVNAKPHRQGLHQFWRPVGALPSGSKSPPPLSPTDTNTSSPFEPPKLASTPSPRLPPFPSHYHIQPLEDLPALTDSPSSASPCFLPPRRTTLVSPPATPLLDFHLTLLPSATHDLGPFPDLSCWSDPPHPRLDYCSAKETHRELTTLLPHPADTVRPWLSTLSDPEHLHPIPRHDWCTAFQPRRLREVLGQASILTPLRIWLKTWQRSLRPTRPSTAKKKRSSPERTLLGGVVSKRRKLQRNGSGSTPAPILPFSDPVPFPESAPPPSLTESLAWPSNEEADNDNDNDVEILEGWLDPFCEVPFQPMLLLEGASGTCKTSLVYAGAAQFGFEVFEINASTRRSGREVEAVLGTLTQTYSVDSMKPWLVYIAQADVLFEDDSGCYASLVQLAQHSKCPMVLACESARSLPPALLQLCVRLHTQAPRLDLLAWYLQCRLYSQGLSVRRQSLAEWCRTAPAADGSSPVPCALKYALRQLEVWALPLEDRPVDRVVSPTPVLNGTPATDLVKMHWQAHLSSLLDQCHRSVYPKLLELTAPDAPPPCPPPMTTPPSFSSLSSPSSSSSSALSSSSPPTSSPSSPSGFLLSSRELMLRNQLEPATHPHLQFHFHVTQFVRTLLRPTVTMVSPFPLFDDYIPFLATYAPLHLSVTEQRMHLIPFALRIVRWNLQQYANVSPSLTRRKTKRSQAAPYFDLLTRSCIEDMDRAFS